MKLAKSFDWQGRYGCPCESDGCRRFYCPAHRLLYRSCDTLVNVVDLGAWEDGGDRRWKEATGDCPRCEETRRSMRQEQIYVRSKTAGVDPRPKGENEP